jgi:hypothetical protein
MGDISVMFHNNYGESRHFMIWDMGRDPNSPPLIFDGYLDKDQKTDWLTVYADGAWGKVLYQRSDGAATNVDVSNGDDVAMD